MARKTVDPTRAALDAIQEAKEAAKTELSILCPSIDVARAACEVTTLTDLRFSGELERLPDEIGQLVDLEKLSLESNQLETLPPTIGNLTKLRSLYCYSNKLTSLPDEFGALASLQKASLWSNQLATLPSTIGALASLTELELKWNKLRALPDEIAQLAALEELDLESNELEELPRSLAGMAKLRRLKLAKNKLGEFPRGVLDLPMLSELELGQNQITAIPDDISRLTRLEGLSLAQNRLTALPAGLYELPALALLDLSRNRITSISKDIGKLTSLSELTLDDNPIAGMPAEVIATGKDAVFEHLGLITATTVEGDLPPDTERAAIVKLYTPRIEQFVRECKKKSHSREMLPKLTDFVLGKTNVVPPIRRDDHYGFSTLPTHLAKLPDWTFIDRRIVRYIAGTAWHYRQPGHDYFTGYYEQFYARLKPQIEVEGEADVFGRAAAILVEHGLDDGRILRSSLRELDDAMAKDGKPTSYGRWLLAQAKTRLDVIMEIAVEYGGVRDGIVGLFVDHAFETFSKVADRLLVLSPGDSGELHIPYGAYDKLCAVDAARYTPMVIDAVARTGCLACRAEGVKVLAERCGPAHRARAFEIATKNLADISERRNKEERLWFNFDGRIGDGVPKFVEWVLRTFGRDAKAAAFAFAENTKVFDLEVGETIARHLGQDGVDAIAEGLNMSFDSDSIAPHFRRVFAMLAPLDWSKYHDKAWELARSEYREVRHTACLALSRLDAASVLPRALAMLDEKKAHLREAGALIATLLPGDGAAARLDAILVNETSDDVRDLVVARRFGTSDEAKLSAAEASKRAVAARKRGKLDKPVAKWLDEKKLPPVYWKGGKALDADTVRFLLYRQTRLAEIAPEAEAGAIYPLIDRAKSSAFATKLLALVLKNGGVAAKNRFALSVIGLVGGDAVIETLEELAVDKHNENAATTLGLLESNAAARALDRIVKVFRIKYPNVREAAQDAFDRIAQAMGITRFELADSMIPDVPKSIALGKVKARVVIAPDRKLAFLDDKGKAIKNPGKGLTGKAKEALEALRDDVDSASRALRASLEYYMVSGRRWPADRWRSFFLGNPLAFAFAQSLVWGIHPWRGLQASFTVAADRTLRDVQGATVDLSDGVQLVLLHPLDLDAAGREAWQTAFAAAGIEPPFAQMSRPVFAPPSEQRARTMSFEFEERELNGLTFKSRAERLGWRRGSVVDSGAVSAYRKTFERHQIDAFIGTGNLGVQSYDGGDVSLEELFFVKSGSVVTGSYTYDEPRDESDQRLLKLGDVPAIVYSEAIADLHAVTREAREE